MRPSHKSRSRNRHRSGGGGGGGSSGGNPLSRVYESNGPDVKVRGTAQTVADKYLQLGRDAQSSGDIVMAESYFQHAEHYLRIVSAAQAYNQQTQQQYRRPDEEFDDEDLEDPGEATVEQRGIPAQPEAEGLGDQPVIDGSMPERAPQPQQQTGNYRPPRDDRYTRDRDERYSRDHNRDNRDQPNRDPNRDQGQGRDYNRDQNRDRYKPRWQDRRPDAQQGQSGEPRQAQTQPPPRADDQPRIADAAPAPQPAPGPQAPESGTWEAPSFLRRPAATPAERAAATPIPAPAAAPPAIPAPVPAAAAVEVSAEAPPPAPAAAPAPAKRKYERKPRKEAAAETPAPKPPVTEPAGD